MPGMSLRCRPDAAIRCNNSNKLKLIEVQLGEEISAQDKQKFELEY